MIVLTVDEIKQQYPNAVFPPFNGKTLLDVNGNVISRVELFQTGSYRLLDVVPSAQGTLTDATTDR